MHKYCKTKGDIVFDIFNNVSMILLCICFIYPFWDVIVLSFSSPKTASNLGLRIFPIDFSLDAYKEVLRSEVIYSGLYNSLFRTIIGTVLTTILTYFGAYGLSKKKLPFRNAITLFILFTMFFGGGLIPSYMLVKDLGLMGSRWSLILPGLTNAWFLIIARNFIMELPESLEEAALLDGASPFQMICKIMLPLSLPIISVIALWSAVGHWNSWFDAMIYCKVQGKLVLQLVLRMILIEKTPAGTGILPGGVLYASNTKTTPETVKAASIAITIFPIICTYPFLQKYFVKGIMIGALKG